MTPPPRQFRWIISQIGWREHYACPVSMQRRGALRVFFTDAWFASSRRILARLPRPFRGLARYYHPEIPREKVVSFTVGCLRRGGADRPRASSELRYTHFERYGRWFAGRVARQMKSLDLDPECDVHLAYSTGALESLTHAKDRGLFCMVDQLDPAKVDEQLIREESARWPDWDAHPGTIPDSYYARLAGEWTLADRLIVNSEFSRRAIHEQGVPLDKIVVVPLAYEPEVTGITHKQPPSAGAPLHVLWLGQVILRKGIPYLFEAARLLKDRNIRFTVAGRIGISERAVKAAPPNVQLLGQIPREQALRLYRQAHVFVLPTISDGFAITQLEAMSFGLPVVVTPNCGDVVTNGKDGLIIPIRDARALADAIDRLNADRALLAGMSDAALATAQCFTMDRFAAGLENAAAHPAAVAPPSNPMPRALAS